MTAKHSTLISLRTKKIPSKVEPQWVVQVALMCLIFLVA
jgi:hypothetical protein